MKSGIELIAAERERQITAEGWTPEHDDKHTDHALVSASVAYMMQANSITSKVTLPECFVPKFWPWSREWWKPSPDPVRNLVKAGALIAAEIDRLQRIPKQ